MKKVIALILSLVMIVTALPVMAAEEEKIFTTLYSSEVSTMNYLTTSTTWDMSFGANMIDTLIEYNSYAEVIPGLAYDWKFVDNEDGTQTWTFYLRQGVKWYDSNCKPVAEVTAQDFVDAMKYVLTPEYESGISYLVVDAANIVNAGAYENGEITDFSLVGVRAVDTYTLEYTCSQPTPYFLSCLTYGCFMPAYGPLLESAGADFGTTTETIYSCGAFILTEFVPQDKHVFVKNVNNWDAEHIYIDGITRTYVPESGTLAPVMAQRGQIDSAELSLDIIDDWRNDPKWSKYITRDRALPDYSYFYCFNFDPTYDEEYGPENWRIAVNNENFRHSIMSGFDRTYAMRATEPEDPESVMQYTITPRTFADVGGVDFTDLPAFDGVEDLFFNPDKALEYKAKAIEELTAQGVTFPVTMVVVYRVDDPEWQNESILLKQQLEGLLGTDYIKIELVGGGAQGFLNQYRRCGNYSFMRCNYGGDYVDPATWTDATPVGNNYNFMDKMYDSKYAAFNAGTVAVLDEYYPAVAAAKKITNDTLARYNALAAAERILLDHAIVVPFFIYPSTYTVTKLNPFEGAYAPFGMSTLRYKYQVLHDDFVTAEEYAASEAEWLEAMSKKK